MSEKATLVNSVPPVKKTGANADGSVGAAGGGSVEAVSGGGGTMVEQAGESITMFQAVIHGSFIVTFCLAGLAAVVLFRKGLLVKEPRFSNPAKLFAGAGVLIALHGVFSAYLYSSYLNGDIRAVPLAFCVAGWILAAPVIGAVLAYLLAPREKPAIGSLVFDSVAFVVIMGAATVGLIEGVRDNVRLIAVLLSGFLYIVPIARFMNVYRTAKARHRELKEFSNEVLVYLLLFLPAAVPVLSFAYVLGLPGEVTQFLFNLTMFNLLLLGGVSMMVSMKDLETVPRAEKKAAKANAEEEEQSTAQSAGASADAGDAPIRETAGAKTVNGKPEPVPPGKRVPKKKAPPKPGKPAAPSRNSRGEGEQGESGKEGTAPNAPSRLRAPVKPRKRF